MDLPDVNVIFRIGLNRVAETPTCTVYPLT